MHHRASRPLLDLPPPPLSRDRPTDRHRGRFPVRPAAHRGVRRAQPGAGRVRRTRTGRAPSRQPPGCRRDRRARHDDAEHATGRAVPDPQRCCVPGECRRAGVVRLQPRRRGVRPCSSAASFTNLESGWHIFAVRAIDIAGNADPTPSQVRWHASGGH